MISEKTNMPILTLTKKTDIPLDEIVDVEEIVEYIYECIDNKMEDWILNDDELLHTLGNACCQYLGWRLLERED